MLVIKRRPGESAVIIVKGERVVITQKEKDRWAFEADKDVVRILRSELEDDRGRAA